MSRKSLLWLVLLLLLAGLAGYTVLINPDNPLTRLFQRKITDLDTRIVIGPYPVERDFRILRSGHVTLVVSLLDPAIPYEKTLLEKERRLAAENGMRLENYPMSSILGRKFGGYYADSAAQAAQRIAATGEKVYLHCYLGLHRIQVVQDLLAARGVTSGRYLVRQGERDKSRLILDAAEAAYNDRRYEATLATLAQLKAAELPVAAQLLQAWSHFRLEHFAEAGAVFAAVQASAPGNADAAVGAGYCALRQGRTAEAEKSFAAALRLAPENAEALGGLGLVQFREGRLEEAARNLAAALRLSPENTELREVLARIPQPPAQ